jgi:hemoglobin
MELSTTIDEAALEALVRRFYAKVRLDPVIGPVFNTAIQDWEPHLERITAFWSSVMLTSGRYHGNPMAVHFKHKITPPMFDRWLALWAETVDEQFAGAGAAADALKQKAELIGQSLKLGLFYRAKRPAAAG